MEFVAASSARVQHANNVFTKQFIDFIKTPWATHTSPWLENEMIYFTFGISNDLENVWQLNGCVRKIDAKIVSGTDYTGDQKFAHEYQVIQTFSTKIVLISNWGVHFGDYK